MHAKRDHHDPPPPGAGRPGDPLVTVEIQREIDLLSGAWAERTFVKLYVAARESGLLAAISDRDWKTLCTLATYMDGDGYCFPSQAELAAAMGCSRQMANERVKSLAGFRFRGQQVLLVVKGERTAAGGWARNGYRVLPIARLRIYDDAGTEPDDSANDSAQAEGPAVSRKLDTAATPRPTVSSPTGTVQLDTNKKHSLELDLNVSNFEGLIHNVDNSGGAGRRSANGPEGVPAQPPAGDPGPGPDPEERELLAAYLADFAAELGDEAPLSSTITRARNAFRDAGVPAAAWGDLLYRARVIAQEHTAQITKRAGDGSGGLRRKNKMPYFFATLEQLLALRSVATRCVGDGPR